MWIDTQQARLRLKPLQPLHLQQARGTRLRAAQGTVWVTVDHDRRDIVLLAGQDFVIDSAQAVIVTPMGGPATLDVCAPSRGAAGGPAGLLARQAARAAAMAAWAWLQGLGRGEWQARADGTAAAR